MKKLLLASLLVLGLGGTAQAAVTDWPVVGQVARVGQCIVQEGAGILADLVGAVTGVVTRSVVKVGTCLVHITTEAVDAVEDVATLQIPTPDPVVATEEMVHE